MTNKNFVNVKIKDEIQKDYELIDCEINFYLTLHIRGEFRWTIWIVLLDVSLGFCRFNGFYGIFCCCIRTYRKYTVNRLALSI